MTAYNISENGQYMVSLIDDDTDNVRRVWFFDSMQEADEYVNWWNASLEQMSA